MRELTLIRHAKSSWDDPDLRDFDRPLNKRGKRNAPMMAARLARHANAPHALVSSPAARALATAWHFAASLEIDKLDIAQDARIYHASPRVLMDVIAEFDPGARRTAMFGHNPGLSELCHRLASVPFDQMPTCAIVILELDIKHWEQITPGCGRLLAYMYPKDGGD